MASQRKSKMLDQPLQSVYTFFAGEPLEELEGLPVPNTVERSLELRKSGWSQALADDQAQLECVEAKEMNAKMIKPLKRLREVNEAVRRNTMIQWLAVGGHFANWFAMHQSFQKFERSVSSAAAGIADFEG